MFDPLTKIIKSLARREHSRYELDQKLVRDFPDLTAFMRLKILDQLKSQNLQSDERFTEMFVRSRLRRGHGRLRIEKELESHGINSGYVERYLSDTNVNDVDRAIDVLEKWVRGKTDPTRVKAYRFLVGRGFSFSHAKEAVNVIFR